MTQVLQTQKTANLLPGVEAIERNPMGDPPAGLWIDNMRVRGVDRCSFKIDNDAARRGKLGWLRLFRRSGLQICVINIASDRVTFGPDPRARRRTPEIEIALADFKSVTMRRPTAMKPGALAIHYTQASGGKNASLEVGSGLSEPALTWLRDRLLLEVAGLVAKPLFNLGRRTTRNTTNPDNEPYLGWIGKRFRLTDLLLGEALERLRQIQTALVEEDWEAAIRHSDYMKSSSAAGGAMVLSDLFQRLEISCTTNDPIEAAAMLAHIRAEYEKIKKRVTSGANVHNEGEDKDGNAEPVDADAGNPQFADKHVLLIEDSLVNQELVLDCLKSAGCQVTTAKTGEAGIELWLKTQFDLILMDCQMPGMGGLEATRSIRRAEFARSRKRVPIIALTANALEGDRELCFAAGMNGYLSKPYHQDDLLQVMQQWLVGPTANQSVSSADRDHPSAMTAV